MAFGTKRRSDWNAQDNATHAVATMLGAEMRNKREQASAVAFRVSAALAGLVVAAAYLLADAFLF